MPLRGPDLEELLRPAVDASRLATLPKPLPDSADMLACCHQTIRLLTCIIGLLKREVLSEEQLRRQFGDYIVRKTNVSINTTVINVANEDPNRLLLFFSHNFGATTISILPRGIGGIDGAIVLTAIGQTHRVSYDDSYGLSQVGWQGFAGAAASLGVIEVFRNRANSPLPGTS